MGRRSYSHGTRGKETNGIGAVSGAFCHGPPRGETVCDGEKNGRPTESGIIWEVAGQKGREWELRGEPTKGGGAETENSAPFSIIAAWFEIEGSERSSVDFQWRGCWDHKNAALSSRQSLPGLLGAGGNTGWKTTTAQTGAARGRTKPQNGWEFKKTRKWAFIRPAQIFRGTPVVQKSWPHHVF